MYMFNFLGGLKKSFHPYTTHAWGVVYMFDFLVGLMKAFHTYTEHALGVVYMFDFLGWVLKRACVNPDPMKLALIKRSTQKSVAGLKYLMG